VQLIKGTKAANNSNLKWRKMEKMLKAAKEAAGNERRSER